MSTLLAATITGIVTLPQQVRHVEVARADPGASVDDQHRDVGVGQRGARLLLDLPGEVVALVEVDAAGVDQRQRPPVPVGVSSLRSRVTPGQLVHDRLPRLA